MATHPAGLPQNLQSIDPASGQVLAEFQPAGEEQVAAAVARAGEAFPAWRSLHVGDRARYLRRLKEILYARRGEIAALITREAGKPLFEALMAEVVVVLDTLEYFARHAQGFLAPRAVPHHNPAMKLKRGRLEYEPYGVIGIIAPSNYPFSIPLGEVIPALVAGNTIVLKPSELTPQVGLAIRDLFVAAELPPGVATVLLGDALTGRALVSANIQKLVFTGSVPTGRRLQAAAAERLLPTLLELGGKDAMVVCADADLEAASSGAVWGAFTNAGQACISVERLYVAHEIAQDFTRRCVEKTKRLRLGEGSDPDVDVGPLIRERQVRIVEEHVADAVARGAEILAGGKRPARPGFFYEPTVLARVHHGMRIMREETFGPVLPIMEFRDEGEAVELANDSEFGLAASVWTRDRRRGERLARRLQAGAVMVNDCMSYYVICEAPHGGVKASGIGRSHSQLGLMEMVHVKYIDVDLAPRLPKVWWFGYDLKGLRLMQGFADFLFARSLVRRARGLATAAGNFLKKRRV